MHSNRYYRVVVEGQYVCVSVSVCVSVCLYLAVYIDMFVCLLFDRKTETERHRHIET